MKAVPASIQNTFLRGIFLLIPVLALGLLIGKAVGLLRTLVEPIAGDMGPLAGIPMPGLIAAVVLVLITFLAGLFSKAPISHKPVAWLESRVLAQIPGYLYMKGMGESMAGVEGATRYQPVLARIEDAWQFGFVVETIEAGQYAVYVPGAPSPWSGSLYFMSEDRIRKVDLSLGDVQGCLKRLGIGSGALLRGKL